MAPRGSSMCFYFKTIHVTCMLVYTCDVGPIFVKLQSILRVTSAPFIAMISQWFRICLELELM